MTSSKRVANVKSQNAIKPNTPTIVSQAEDHIKARYNIPKSSNLNNRTFRKHYVPPSVIQLFYEIRQNPSNESLEKLRSLLNPQTTSTPTITDPNSPNPTPTAANSITNGSTRDNIDLVHERSSDISSNSVTTDQKAKYEEIVSDISSIIEKEDDETLTKLLDIEFEENRTVRDFYVALPHAEHLTLQEYNSLMPRLNQLSQLLKEAVKVTPKQIDDYRKIVDDINGLIAKQDDQVQSALSEYRITYRQGSRTEKTTVLNLLEKLPSVDHLTQLAESGRLTLSNFNQLFEWVNQFNQLLTNTVIPALLTPKQLDNVDNESQVSFTRNEVSEIQGKLSELEGSLTRLAPDKDHQHSLLGLKVKIGEEFFTVGQIIDSAKNINETTKKPNEQAHKTVLDTITKALEALTQQGPSFITATIEVSEYKRILTIIQGILKNTKFPKKLDLNILPGLDEQGLQKLLTAIHSVKNLDCEHITLDDLEIPKDDLMKLLTDVNSILARTIAQEEASAPSAGITQAQKDILQNMLQKL